ncbi:Proline iminopeptidase [Colletotrichum fructicola Nara gc5]|uniref:Proline iminopeptidase n=2 Tax=Colletotrichum fructicola (strain Nara gc5) TaxID=1213859 RepID=A0A7J6JJU8_COLFN|nr:Proline iminopeptidase [Colletotrichum fructicola Nara gc5]
MQAVEGLIPFHHESFPSGFHSQTWYKIIGDRNSDHTPLIVLHGGPGYTHHYLKPTFGLFARQTSTPVIFYDQIGNGNSTHIRDRRLDEAFWNVDLFVAELQNLVAKLGLEGGFSLYGHSWGAMLALKYVATRQPQGLQKIILGSGPASMALWKNAARDWLAALPPRQAALLEEYRMGSIQGSTEVDHALEELDKLTTLMKEPFPRGLQESLKWLKEDNTVLLSTNGPNDLCDEGSMRDLDVSDDCVSIQVPVLMISGDQDGATSATTTPLYEKLPTVKWVGIPGGSHMVHLEQPESYNL